MLSFVRVSLSPVDRARSTRPPVTTKHETLPGLLLRPEPQGQPHGPDGGRAHLGAVEGQGGTPRGLGRDEAGASLVLFGLTWQDLAMASMAWQWSRQALAKGAGAEASGAALLGVPRKVASSHVLGVFAVSEPVPPPPGPVGHGQVLARARPGLFGGEMMLSNFYIIDH